MKNKRTLLMVFAFMFFIITGCNNQSIENNKNDLFTVEKVDLSNEKPLPPGTVLEIDFPFPYVFWGNETYEIYLDQELDQSKIEERVGEVKRYISSTYIVPSEQSKIFENRNGDSNLLGVGSKIFKVSRKNIENEMAVEYKGKFYKAKVNN